MCSNIFNKILENRTQTYIKKIISQSSWLHSGDAGKVHPHNTNVIIYISRPKTEFTRPSQYTQKRAFYKIQHTFMRI